MDPASSVFPHVLEWVPKTWCWFPQNQTEIRAWIPGVYLGSDPRETNEEVGEVRQGGEESQ